MMVADGANGIILMMWANSIDDMEDDIVGKVNDIDDKNGDIGDVGWGCERNNIDVSE